MVLKFLRISTHESCLWLPIAFGTGHDIYWWLSVTAVYLCPCDFYCPTNSVYMIRVTRLTTPLHEKVCTLILPRIWYFFLWLVEKLSGKLTVDLMKVEVKRKFRSNYLSFHKHILFEIGQNRLKIYRVFLINSSVFGEDWSWRSFRQLPNSKRFLHNRRSSLLNRSRLQWTTRHCPS